MIAVIALVLLLVTNRVQSQQSSCGSVCQGNQKCQQKCSEYEKNPNRHPLSTPYCGLSSLDDNNNVSFPWLASLQYKSEQEEEKATHRPHFCTAIILNQDFILSSAHCIPKDPGSYNVMIGSESISLQDQKAMLLEIETFTIPGLLHKQWIRRHDSYSEIRNKGNNDLVLIKTAVKMTPKIEGNTFVVNSICLPENNYKPSGLALVVGWGSIGVDRKPVTEVMKANNMIITNEQANTFIKQHKVWFGDQGGQLYFVYNVTFRDQDFITMASRAPGLGKQDLNAYQGDSGAPIVKIIEGRAFTLGINHAINKGDIPLNIWARIQYYSSWIEKTMRKSLWDLDAYRQFG